MGAFDFLRWLFAALTGDHKIGLIRGRSWLNERELRTLTVKQARALISSRAILNLTGLKSLPLKVAQELGRRGDGTDLFLDGLIEISPAVAEALITQGKQAPPLDGEIEFNCLSLNGLWHISPDVAKALAGHEGALFLDGVTTLSEEAARTLATREHTLSMNGLTSLSETGSAALRANARIGLPDRFRFPKADR